MEDYGLILVDCLNGFFKEGALANPDNMKMIPGIKALGEKAKYIYAVCDTHEENDKEFEVWPPHCINGTPESQIVEELNDLKMWRINKTRYSGFFESNLWTGIRRHNDMPWVVVGVCTDMCILGNIFGLRARDFNVIVPRDCVDTFDIPGHNAAEVNKMMLDVIFPIVLGVKVVPSYKDLL